MIRRGVARAIGSSRRTTVVATRHYTLQPDDPPSYAKYPPPERPEGVPDTWSAADIQTDLGFFEDDCFPSALPGETLEEYCRRVPNVWSPCSRSMDVVDCPVYLSLEFAEDILCEDHQFTERPVVKIPPLDSDWHAMHEIEMTIENPPDPYTVNGINPPKLNERNVIAIMAEQEAIMKMITEGAERLGNAHWFSADTFEDFWVELTGKTLKEVKLEEHLEAWLEANPGKTLNDIQHAFNPGLPKEEGFDKVFDPNRVPFVPPDYKGDQEEIKDQVKIAADIEKKVHAGHH